MSPRVPLAPTALLALALPLLSACEAARVAAPGEGAPPAATDGPPTGATVEDLGAAAPADGAAARAPPAAAPAGSLGLTTATLGPPGKDGLWLATPLVGAPTPGRVVYGANGRAIAVELRPSGGEPGSGSQISLAAIRALGAPLTGILEIEVFAG